MWEKKKNFISRELSVFYIKCLEDKLIKHHCNANIVFNLIVLALGITLEDYNNFRVGTKILNHEQADILKGKFSLSLKDAVRIQINNATCHVPKLTMILMSLTKKFSLIQKKLKKYTSPSKHHFTKIVHTKESKSMDRQPLEQ